MHGNRLPFALSTPEPATLRGSSLSRLCLGRSGGALSPSPPCLSAAPPSLVHLFDPPLLSTSYMLPGSIYSCSSRGGKLKHHVLKEAFMSYLQIRSSPPQPLCFFSHSALFSMAWLLWEVVRAEGRWFLSLTAASTPPHQPTGHPPIGVPSEDWQNELTPNTTIPVSQARFIWFIFYSERTWKFGSEIGVLRGLVKKRKWQQGEVTHNSRWPWRTLFYMVVRLSAGNLSRWLHFCINLSGRRESPKQ